MKYLLDTNIISYFVTNRYPNVRMHFQKVCSHNISIPHIVLAEIEYGARKSHDYKKTINIYKKFCDVFNKSHFNDKAIHWYGIIRDRLEKDGLTIGANDLIVASIALAEERVLVTHNIKEFSRIPELTIEDWTSE